MIVSVSQMIIWTITRTPACCVWNQEIKDTFEFIYFNMKDSYVHSFPPL